MHRGLHIVGSPALALRPLCSACADPTATPTPTATPVPAPTATPTPEPPPSDEDLTHAYVTSAIDYYGKNGREATVEYYKSGESIEDGRTLILIDKAESVLLAYQPIPALAGQYVGPGSRFSAFGGLISLATGEGEWFTTRGITRYKQEDPVGLAVARRLVFCGSRPGGGHSGFHQEYVNKAVTIQQRWLTLSSPNQPDAWNGRSTCSHSETTSTSLIPSSLTSSAPTSRTWSVPTGRSWGRR